MRLNTLSPAFGSTKSKKRVGRGIGCTLGKTCGRGHKGQHSRSGGYHMIGFEGGQMPFQRRIPKFGFRSRKALVTAEVNLSEINSMPQEIVDMTALYAANIISGKIKRVKVIASGAISRKVQLQGIKATKGALAAIEAAGGSVSQG